MSATTEETTTPDTGDRNTGTIVEIQGVVIEAVFPDKMPEIYNAILVKRPEAARAEEDEDHRRARARNTSSARSSSTSAMTACARSPWTPPTGSPAAPR